MKELVSELQIKRWLKIVDENLYNIFVNRGIEGYFSAIYKKVEIEIEFHEEYGGIKYFFIEIKDATAWWKDYYYIVNTLKRIVYNYVPFKIDPSGSIQYEKTLKNKCFELEEYETDEMMEKINKNKWEVYDLIEYRDDGRIVKPERLVRLKPAKKIEDWKFNFYYDTEDYCVVFSHLDFPALYRVTEKVHEDFYK